MQSSIRRSFFLSMKPSELDAGHNREGAERVSTQTRGERVRGRGGAAQWQGCAPREAQRSAGAERAAQRHGAAHSKSLIWPAKRVGYSVVSKRSIMLIPLFPASRLS